MSRNLKFLTAEKIRFKKNQTFPRSAQYFLLQVPKRATELKKWSIHVHVYAIGNLHAGPETVYSR
jgi:hypothetical protein